MKFRPAESPGLKNCAWLKKLNASARKTRDWPSVMRVLLETDKSVFRIPGPWNTLRPRFPYRPAPAAAEPAVPTRRKYGFAAASPVPPPEPSKYGLDKPNWLVRGS